jgi:tetratricopeptide (TPR) repeat protein
LKRLLHFAAFAALVGVVTVSVCSSFAEVDVFTSSGHHREIETFLDSKHRFIAAHDIDEPDRQLTKARSSFNTLKPESGLTYARAASELGCALIEKEKYDEAEPLLKEALKIREARLAKNDPDVAAANHNLGALYELRKSGGDPSNYYFEALKIVTEAKPTRFRAYEERNLGEFLYSKHQLEQAESMFRRSVNDHDELSSKPSAELADILQTLSLCMEEEGHGKAAEPFDHRSEQMYKRLPKEKVPRGWASGSFSGP